MAIPAARSCLIRFSISNEDWIISCLVTSVNAPKVFGVREMLPIVISDSPAAPPSELIKAACEAAVFLGILTSPDRPLRFVAKGITAELFLRTSIKSCPL